MPLENKSIAMVIAFRNFRDEEYLVPKEILEKAGASITTVSNKEGIARGAGGSEAKVDLLVSQVNMDNFDALVFVGGPGCLENLDNKDSYNLIQEAIQKKKLLASICISPVILAKSGVLKGKKATVWHSPLYRSSIKALEDNGAIFEDKKVVVDGNIITANGPQAAKEFGLTIISLLK